MATTAREPAPDLYVPEDSECGEAMLALTRPQRAFVMALIESGATNHTLAAIRAGYAGTENSARVVACRMMQSSKIIAAIREQADRAMQGDALLGRAVLVEIARDSRHKDRFKAGVELLNRAGLLVETRQRLIVEDNRDTEQLRAEVLGLLERAFKGKPLPAALAPPVEAEFVEVPVSNEAQAVHSIMRDPNDISDLLGEV